MAQVIEKIRHHSTFDSCDNAIWSARTKTVKLCCMKALQTWAGCVLFGTWMMGCAPAGPTDAGGAGGAPAVAGCAVGLIECNGVCVNLLSDALNCGQCTLACAAEAVCSQGACATGCASGEQQCGQSCVNLANDPTHCGVCNNACPAGGSCEASACLAPTAAGGANGGGSGIGGGSGVGGDGVDVGAGGGDLGTSGGGPGTGGEASTGEPPIGVTGVVVAIDDEGTLGCVPLCTDSEHPEDTDTTDDWADEGWACVLSDSSTGTRNQSCITGEELPAIDRSGLPGVVMAVDSDGALACVPLCEEGAEPSSEDNTDWGWEFQDSCIIRDTTSSNCNQGCTTGAALPDSTLIQRPGGLDSDDACVALCACVTVGDDPEYPDWGWEFQAACIVPNSETADGKPECTTNEGSSLVPPAVSGATAPGFYTQNGRLYDAKGSEFVMRGVNNPHVWADVGGQYRAYQALDKIKSYGTNTIRVVWETNEEGGTPALLRRILYRIVELKMVPMVELHDATGSSSTAELQNMAAYWARDDVAEVLNDFREYLLINIANEWSGSDYQNAYKSAIATIRSAGLTHTLVIDAGGFGQDFSTIQNNAAALIAADAESNLLFSLHMYSQYSSSGQVDAVLDNSALGSTIPFIVGEFGWRLQGASVAWQRITEKCNQRGFGYLAWSWSGNDAANAELDIVNDWGGSLTPSWGQQIMVNDAYSIQKTAAQASIFN